MKNWKAPFFLASFAITILFAACNDDEAVVVCECGNIAISFLLTPVDGGDSKVFSFSDPDGEGGNDPIIEIATLDANTTYTGAISLTGLSSSEEVEDFTREIQEENEEFQFFFTTVDANLTVAYADMDTNGNPIGLTTNITTGDASAGTMTIILRHEPDKNEEGVADGDITHAGGETDVEITFDVIIQ